MPAELAAGASRNKNTGAESKTNDILFLACERGVLRSGAIDLEVSLPGGWEEEVKEILERADALEKKTGRRRPVPLPRAPRARVNPLITIGDFLRRRVATTRDMATTGIIVIFVGLILVAVPGGRYLSPLLALIGLGLLLAAYLGSLRRNRSTSAPTSGKKMWRGQVLDEDDDLEPPESFLKRLFNRGRRDS